MRSIVRWRPSKHRNAARHSLRADLAHSRGSQAMLRARRSVVTRAPNSAHFVLPDGTKVADIDVMRGTAHLPGANAVKSEREQLAARQARNQRKRARQHYRAHRRRRDAA